MTHPSGTIGFTGTSHGMAPRQRKMVRQLLYGVNTLHLGDCVGADAEAYTDAIALGITTIGHPPDNNRKRAFCLYSTEHHVAPYLTRNRHIVAGGVDGLIAAPRGYVEELRSGTWATVRYARQAKRRIWIVRPDGTVVTEGM